MNHARKRGRKPVAEAADAALLRATYLAEAADLDGALALAIRDLLQLSHTLDGLAESVSCGFVRQSRAALLTHNPREPSRSGSALFDAIEHLNAQAATLKRALGSPEEAVEWITDNVIAAERAVYQAPVQSIAELMAKIAIFEIEQAEMLDPDNGAPELGGEALRAILEDLRRLIGYDLRMMSTGVE